MSAGAVERAIAILRDTCGDRVKLGFPLAPLTTFRIGGPAAVFLEPEDERDLAAVSDAVITCGLPFAVLGKGSNVLVADAGFPGLVLRLGRGLRWAGRDGDRLVAGGAMPVPALAGVALRHGLAGMGFGVAIPASLGGAVRMNAGAHGQEIGDLVQEARLWMLLDGTAASWGAEQVGFSYRRTELPDEAVVIGATLSLRPGEATVIRAEMQEARRWRRATQPLAEPNCGSVFTNPPDGPSAAELIQGVGAKGLRVGGASVSRKHANFIVAAEGTSAGDVIGLIERVRDLVRDASGVELETEVRMIGEVAPASA